MTNRLWSSFILSCFTLSSLFTQVAFAADNTFPIQSNTSIASGAECSETSSKVFNRVATFPVCKILDANCNTDEEYAAEIVASDSNGNTLIFTNSPANAIGFVDITDPAAPVAAGQLILDGEPTSIATRDGYALVAVNLSEDFVNTAGELVIVDIKKQNVVGKINLGGQPDSIAVSPDQKFAVVAIENERDEDLNDGEIPQLPAGYVEVIDISHNNPKKWIAKKVDVTGLAEIAPSDPEPEYVDINDNNIAVVTLQENNHIVLIDLSTLKVTNHFPAGFVDLINIDTEEEEPALINPTDSQQQIPREPDGVSWINNEFLATADEGDYNGGSRGFTIFSSAGNIVYTSGNDLDLLTINLGHYPDSRSGNKGNEPENVEFGEFEETPFLFVASERSSLVFVYDIHSAEFPMLKQTLPAAAAPEGVLALPQRGLMIAASEEDNRDDKLRSSLNIYQYQDAEIAYPNISSGYYEDGSPIPWAALSGLAASPFQNNILYAVDDSYFQKNRIFKITLTNGKGFIYKDFQITDPKGVFANLPAVKVAEGLEPESAERADVFDSVDRAAITNDDATVNLDLEGISVTQNAFWVVSEGAGTVGDEDRPVNSLNSLIKVNFKGEVAEVITLPEQLNAMQLRFGFEGVAVDENKIVVVFQRAWGEEEHPRLGIYNRKTKTWKFVYYPLDAPESPAGGWVGLSDITALDENRFLVLERDNQAGPDAKIKRIYEINLIDITDGEIIEKHLAKDLMPMLEKSPSPVPEKLEGIAALSDGTIYINNDNDGVDDNSGENILIKIDSLK